MEPDAALALCRFLHDAAGMLIWGACGYLAVFVQPELAQDVERRLRPILVIAAVLAVAATAAMLPIEAAAIGEGWGDALAPSTLGDVLFETSVGHAWGVQAWAALLLLAAAVIPVRHRLGAMTAAAGLVLASLALTGHAAMHRGALGATHRLNDVLHLLSGGAWAGALVTLVPLLARLAEGERRPAVIDALRPFSSAGHVAVALVLATGVANTALVLGRWPTDWSSPYQAMLAGKIALVLVMVALALLNRYTLVPLMERSPVRVVAAIRAGTIAEVVLGLGVLGLVSVFGLLEPA